MPSITRTLKINFCSYESITGPKKVKHNSSPSSERGRARRRGYGSQAARVMVGEILSRGRATFFYLFILF